MSIFPRDPWLDLASRGIQNYGCNGQRYAACYLDSGENHETNETVRIEIRICKKGLLEFCVSLAECDNGHDCMNARCLTIKRVSW